MQLGFVSAILEDLSFAEVLNFAAEEGFECVEVMCWPTGSGDARRYAGTTHIDVTNLDEAKARKSTLAAPTPESESRPWATTRIH